MEERAPFAHADQKNMTLADEVGHFIAECEALAKAPVTADTAPRFRKLQDDEVKLRKRIEKTHEEEKRPHLEAGRVVDAKYLPHIPKLKEAVKAITAALTKFMEAEEAKALAAAEETRRRAEEEERKARELAQAAETEADPFDAFDRTEDARRAEAEASALARQAAAPVKVNVANLGGGRAASLRTVGWIVEVEDPAALVAYYAERREFLELAITLAKAEAKFTKGQAKIPGVKLLADRRAA